MAKLRLIGKVWYSDLYIGGKRVVKALSKNKRIAENRLGDLIDQRDAKRHGHAPANAPWPDFKARFLKDRSTKAANTYTQYQRAIRNLEAFQPITHVAQIMPGLLADLWTDWKTPKGDEQKTRGLYVRNRDLQSLKAMMRTAEVWGLVSKQDWSSLKRDKEPKGRLLWYTAKEMEHLLKVCHGTWETVARLGARAGLRRGEIHWLPIREGLDFLRDRIHIAPVYDDRGILLWKPKDHERRWIPMTPDLKSHLLKIVKRKKGRWVIEEDGERPTLGSMTNYFRRLIRKAGLKGSIHTLRHTFGSHLASGGASPKVIKELMGHSRLEMTDRYMHLAPDAQQSATQFLPPMK